MAGPVVDPREHGLTTGPHANAMSWPGSPGAPIPRRALPPPCDPVVAARGTIPYDGLAVRLERGENLAGTPSASRAPPAGDAPEGVTTPPPPRHPPPAKN